MKYILLAVMLTLTACASTTEAVKTSSDSPDAGVIRVLGTGSTKEEAKNNGFNTAIEIAVGSALLSQKQVRNDKLVRDEIVKYNAGYVDDYKIIDEIKTSGGYSLLMDVHVKSSRIHERLLSGGGDEKNVNGDKLATQYETYVKQQESADKLIDVLIQDWPEKAFTVKQGTQEFSVDKNRNSVLRIPVEMTMNFKFVNAVDEALKKVNQRKTYSDIKVGVAVKPPDSWLIGYTHGYFFDDIQRVKQFQQGFNNNFQIQVHLKDFKGDLIYSECFDHLRNFSYQTPTAFILQGNASVDSNIEIRIDRELNNTLRRAFTVEMYASSMCVNKRYEKKSTFIPDPKSPCLKGNRI
jgi:hypothetical protein